jgi:hypothetical protein
MFLPYYRTGIVDVVNQYFIFIIYVPCIFLWVKSAEI